MKLYQNSLRGMDLKRFGSERWMIVSLVVFVLCVVTGFVSGVIFRKSEGEGYAASANITVTNNDQTVDYDQAANEMIVNRTSTVTVRDGAAGVGYVLSAKLNEVTPIPGSSVRIYSSASTLCTEVAPCTLNATAQSILRTSTNAAATGDGETTEWQVRISVPGNTNLGNYVVDIEYGEEARVDITSITTMQEATLERCDATPRGTVVNLRDTRDNTYYRVKKMADGRCWMVDNLALDLTTTYDGKPAWGTAPVKVSGRNPSVNNVPQIAENNRSGYESYGRIPNNGAPKFSYLYNWCAALADTSSGCSASVNAVQNNTVINGATNTSGTTTSQPEVTGICPAPFRLPKGGPGATSSNATSTANEFVKFDIAIGGTGANRTSANTYSSFMGTPTDTGYNWMGVLGGYYADELDGHNRSGYWWSSTAGSDAFGYALYLGSIASEVNPADELSRVYGRAVRCLL